MIFYLPLTVLLLSSAGCNQLGGPRDYDECILQSMKGVNSDTAARAIMRSCREKFPERKPEDSQLPPEATQKLTGHGGMGNYGDFSGNIYNGNNDWTVTQVTLMLVPKDSATLPDMKAYNAEVSVSPLKSSTFSFSVDGPRQEYSWSIVSARGYK